MFKKNPNRPQITISLKKVHNGYKVINNEAINPFGFKRITRAVFRCMLVDIQLICTKEPILKGKEISGELIQTHQ